MMAAQLGHIGRGFVLLPFTSIHRPDNPPPEDHDGDDDAVIVWINAPASIHCVSAERGCVEDHPQQRSKPGLENVVSSGNRTKRSRKIFDQRGKVLPLSRPTGEGRGEGRALENPLSWKKLHSALLHRQADITLLRLPFSPAALQFPQTILAPGSPQALETSRYEHPSRNGVFAESGHAIMKLGFLLFDYFPYGGLQRDCLKIAQLCAERGHDVTIYTRTWQGDRPTDLRVFLFGRTGASNIARNRAWMKQLAATLPGEKLNGVIGFNKLPGLDVYYGSDPCYAAKVERLKSFWYKWLPRYRHFKKLEESVFARGQRTHVLVLTEREIPHYEGFYGTERERFHLLPPGIDRHSFTPEQKEDTRLQLRHGYGWENDNLLLLVGSGFRVKGLDRAIRSLAALPIEMREQTRLVVIGQNRPTEFELIARQAGVDDRVHFLGGRDDVFDWLLAADLLVHPARSEAAGMILLEALSAGLPVLATEVCGYAPHIQKANAGRILPSPFVQEQCDTAVREMLVSDERYEWSSNGVTYALREDLYSCHQRAVEIIERVVKKGNRAQAADLNLQI
jgi:UDP-glucose:(heptosyl)LPS alpha-1,3-glucosyltransferase